jgi:dTDP-4-amino-4,6-dideoxygalactose transaminase
MYARIVPLKPINPSILDTVKLPKYIKEEISAKVLNNISNKTPVKTGNLRRSLSYQIIGDQIYFYSDVHYAPYVEQGHYTNAGNFVEGRWMFKNGIQDSVNYIMQTLEQYYMKKLVK